MPNIMILMKSETNIGIKSMKKNELIIKNLYKTYTNGAKPALDNFSATFSQGIYGILGPNGAGKSTLFNIITGVIDFNLGTLAWGDLDLEASRFEFAKNLGYMPQQQQLFDYMTVFRFLEYFGLLKNLSSKYLYEEIERVMFETGITDLQDKKISSLSGGMKQRVLISQAMLGDPPVILLDEPTAGLDPKERIRFRNFISTKALDKIVLIATHIVPDIDSIAKEILILDRGQIIESGATSTILSKYSDISYLGEIPKDKLIYFTKNYQISHLQERPNGLIELTIVGKITDPQDLTQFNFTKIEPSLEDVYLHLFGLEQVEQAAY